MTVSNMNDNDPPTPKGAKARMGHGPTDSSLAREIKQGKPFESVEVEAHLNLVRTCDLLEGNVARFLKQHGISTPQYNVLRILRGAEPEGLPSLAVADRMVTRVPDVTRLLDRLTAKGLVVRERSATDGRVMLAHITADGLAFLAGLDRPLLEYHHGQLGHMSRDELVQLIVLLEKLRAGPAGPAPSRTG